MKKPKANSRQKGAAFERKIAQELFRETGINFKRDLRQYQSADFGDLIADADAWPFVIECKARDKGADAQAAWISQVFKSADATNKHPCLIWRFNNQPIRVRVWFDAIAEAVGGSAVSTQSADVTLQGLAWLAREIMARRAP